MNYVKDVMDTVESALQEYKKIDAEQKRAKKKLDAEELGSKGYADLTESLNIARRDVRMGAQRKLTEIGAAYREQVEADTGIDASMLHDDAKLLQIPGIVLTARQFSALVDKHKANPLMMQILSAYQRSHEGLYADHLPSPEVMIGDFDKFVEIGKLTLANPGSMQAAFFLDGYYTPKSAQATESEE